MRRHIAALRHHRRAHCRQAPPMPGRLQSDREFQSSNHAHDGERWRWPANEFVDTPNSPRRRDGHGLRAGAEDGCHSFGAADLSKNPTRRCAGQLPSGGIEGKGVEDFALERNKIDGMKRTDLCRFVENSMPRACSRMCSGFRANGNGVSDVAGWLRPYAAGALAISRRPGADSPIASCARSRGENHHRLHDEFPMPARRRKWKAQGRLGPHRPDHFCPARWSKSIVLGKGGQTIKTIGELARKEWKFTRAPRPSVLVRQGARGLGENREHREIGWNTL